MLNKYYHILLYNIYEYDLYETSYVIQYELRGEQFGPIVKSV